MRIIVGLGNPGKQYQNTRHNMGFMVVDALARQMKGGVLKFSFDKKSQSEVLQVRKDLWLVKPQTFMNDSGMTVKKILKSSVSNPKSLYVVHDDLDIYLGSYKIQFGKGPREHKGVKSVENHLKTKDFWRVRVGIAGEDYQKLKTLGKSMAEDYVLKPFNLKEREEIKPLFEKIADELKRHFLET